MNDIERVSAAIDHLTQQFPMIASGLVDPQDQALLLPAAQVIHYFLKSQGAAQWEKSLAALAKLSFDFIRLHGRFLKNGRYRASSSKLFEEELYSSPEKMDAYLNGLFLSYALWPNHVKTYQFFDHDFVSRFPGAVNIIEIGVGHGLMAATAMGPIRDSRYFGYDLSRPALEYCKKTLTACGVPDERVVLTQGDATKMETLQPLHSDSTLRRVICCEVLEHVEEPERLLNAILKLTGEKGRAFITTVANIDAEDHIYLFHDANHIRTMIADCGFSIEKEQVLMLDRYATEKIFPLNYSAILCPRQ